MECGRREATGGRRAPCSDRDQGASGTQPLVLPWHHSSPRHGVSDTVLELGRVGFIVFLRCGAQLVLMQKDVDGCRTMPLPDGQQEAGKPARTSASSFFLLSASGLEFQSDASGGHPDTGADAVV